MKQSIITLNHFVVGAVVSLSFYFNIHDGYQSYLCKKDNLSSGIAEFVHSQKDDKRIKWWLTAEVSVFSFQRSCCCLSFLILRAEASVVVVVVVKIGVENCWCWARVESGCESRETTAQRDDWKREGEREGRKRERQIIVAERVEPSSSPNGKTDSKRKKIHSQYNSLISIKLIL